MDPAGSISVDVDAIAGHHEPGTVVLERYKITVRPPVCEVIRELWRRRCQPYGLRVAHLRGLGGVSLPSIHLAIGYARR